MIEWGARSNSLNTVNNDYYWSYSLNNHSEVLVTNTALSLLLPAVNYPRMISLNIAKSSLESPTQADIYFYMNQTFTSLDYTLSMIDTNFNFQGKKGLNIIDWQYSGSLHAIVDPASLSGAIVTIKTAERVYI